jgi:hypothetical protein
LEEVLAIPSEDGATVENMGLSLVVNFAGIVDEAMGIVF